MPSEGESVNTGLKLRGFEVWAVTPHHYRHYHTLFLQVPGEFPTVVFENPNRPGDWNVGFRRPDGEWAYRYVGFKTREEAEETRARHPQTTLGCQFEVWFKKTDESGNARFCDASYPGAKAGGKTWEIYPAYAPLTFELTEDEAGRVLAWREQADKAWFAARPDFLPREKRITDAQVAGLPETAAEFVVDAQDAFGADAVAVVTREEATATECLECGATYSEPGHVEWGGMACDRCK